MSTEGNRLLRTSSSDNELVRQNIREEISLIYRRKIYIFFIGIYCVPQIIINTYILSNCPINNQFFIWNFINTIIVFTYMLQRYIIFKKLNRISIDNPNIVQLSYRILRKENIKYKIHKIIIIIWIIYGISLVSNKNITDGTKKETINLTYYMIIFYIIRELLPIAMKILLCCCFLPYVILFVRRLSNNNMGIDDNKFNEYIASNKISLISAENTTEDICTICLDKYTITDQIVKIECNHIFHKECLKSWYKINASCPICRHKNVEDEDGYV